MIALIAEKREGIAEHCRRLNVRRHPTVPRRAKPFRIIAKGEALLNSQYPTQGTPLAQPRAMGHENIQRPSEMRFGTMTGSAWHPPRAAKGEALPYHSAGQRPAYGYARHFKAEGLADDAVLSARLSALWHCVGRYVGRCPTLSSARPSALRFGTMTDSAWRPRRAAKGEALPYHSAGQRPAYGDAHHSKAEGLAGDAVLSARLSALWHCVGRYVGRCPTLSSARPSALRFGTMTDSAWRPRHAAKGEALPYHSAGQRPAYGYAHHSKAEGLADDAVLSARLSALWHCVGRYVGRCPTLSSARPSALCFGTMTDSAWRPRHAMKGEALPYHSAGQRPAYGDAHHSKAEGLALRGMAG